MSKKVRTKKEKTKKDKANKPLSIFGLLSAIVKGIIKSLPTMWKSILIRSIISFLVVAVFSFYSIAMKNQGFGAVKFLSGTFWGDVINTGRNAMAFNTMCFVATYALTMIFSKIRTEGIKKFFADLVEVFPWTVKCLSESKKLAGPIILYTMSVVMILGLFNSNQVMFITLSITVFLEFTSKEKGLISAFVLASWNDIHRVFKRKKGLPPMNVHHAGLITFGLLMAMIILALMPVERLQMFTIILMIVFIALGTLLTLNKVSTKTVKNTVLLLVVAMSAYKLTGHVLADNGGWYEGGSDFLTYLGSAGSVGVIVTSAVSGLFSVAGGILGVAVGQLMGSTDIKDNWNYGSEIAVALGEDVANEAGDLVDEAIVEVGDAMDETIEEITDTLDDLTNPEIMSETLDGTMDDLSDLVDDLTDPEIMGDTLDETMEDISEFIDDVDDTLESTADAVAEGMQILEDTWGMSEQDLIDLYTDLMDPEIMTETLSNTYEELGGLLQDVYDNPEILLETLTESSGELSNILNDLQDYILTSDNVDWIFDGLEANIPDWIVKSADQAGNAILNMFGNVQGIMNGLNLIPENNPLNSFFGNAGIIKEMLDNIGKGDNAIYAGIKSYIANTVKGALLDGKNLLNGKNPAALMELVSNIFLGGTEADKIVNPGKTIQGTANFLMDYVSDCINGTNDTAKRLAGGDYGGFYQVMDQTFMNATDAAYNPTDFLQLMRGNYSTVDSFFEDIIKNNHNLWQVKENSYITRAFDSLAEPTGSMFQVINNRTASRLGEMIFDGLTYMGQGATHLGIYTYNGVDSAATNFPAAAESFVESLSDAGDSVADGAGYINDTVGEYADSAGSWIKSLW